MRGSAVGWGTVLQAGRSRVWFSKGSLEFFSDLILPVALCSWGPHSLKHKRVPGISPGGEGGRCVGLTTLPPSYADFLKVLGTLTFTIRRGLFRSVQGQLYLYLPPHCVQMWFNFDRIGYIAPTINTPLCNGLDQNAVHLWQTRYTDVYNLALIRINKAKETSAKTQM